MIHYAKIREILKHTLPATAAQKIKRIMGYEEIVSLLQKEPLPEYITINLIEYILSNAYDELKLILLMDEVFINGLSANELKATLEILFENDSDPFNKDLLFNIIKILYDHNYNEKVQLMNYNQETLDYINGIRMAGKLCR